MPILLTSSIRGVIYLSNHWNHRRKPRKYSIWYCKDTFVLRTGYMRKEHTGVSRKVCSATCCITRLARFGDLGFTCKSGGGLRHSWYVWDCRWLWANGLWQICRSLSRSTTSTRWFRLVQLCKDWHRRVGQPIFDACSSVGRISNSHLVQSDFGCVPTIIESIKRPNWP